MPNLSNQPNTIEIRFTGFEQKVLLNQQPFIPKIYWGNAFPEKGFNVVRIALQASVFSLLNWKEALQLARKYTQEGFYILWELEFDLLSISLEEDLQFLTLQLAIEQFNETVWPQFHLSTFGVILFQGVVDEKLKEIVQYLKNLAVSFPDQIVCFLLLDTQAIADAPNYFRLINQEMMGYFQLILKGPYSEKFPWSIPAFAWDHSCSPLGFCSEILQNTLPQKRISRAVCLSEQLNLDHLKDALAILSGIPFRAIPENLLAQEWDGIDQLIIFPGLSSRGERKVRGFSAAGGEVIKFPDDAAWLLLQETSQPFSFGASMQNGQ